MVNIVFMGTPEFSVPVLRQLINDGYHVSRVVTQPDRPVGRKRKLTPPPVKVEAEKNNIPVLQPENLKQSEELQEILKLKPDLIVTAAYGQILPPELLAAPTYGCINVHASILPELRGGAPIHYAIIQGKKKTGITIMYMAEKLDAGDIISQAEVMITEEDDVGSLHDKLSITGARLLSETIPELLKGNIDPKPQNEEEATFAYNIQREQEKIDWNKAGEDIYNQIRGLRPWPVAYTTLNGKILKVWRGEKQEMQQYHHVEPGTIVKLTDTSIIVSTGDSTFIKLTEIQPAGKKKMTTEQFLRGASDTIQIGMVLGK